MKSRSIKVLNHSRVIASVKASMEFEGLRPSGNAQTIGKKYLQGEISSGVAVASIKASHASKFGR